MKPHYFNLWWWHAAFSGCTGIRNFICRMRNHPNGVVYYTDSAATEPNMHCKDCGEDLG